MGKRKRNQEEPATADVGVVMSVSLFLILLSFFILLNSIAVLDERKTRKALGSLIGAFGSFYGGLSPLKTGDSIMPPSAPITDDGLGIEALMSLMDKKMLGEIRLESDRDREIIRIRESLLFEKGSGQLKASSYPLLEEITHLLRKGDYPIEIVGHTDSTPALEKGYRSNWEYTTLMAIQVLKYFVQKGHISPRRLTAYGCGDQRPVASNESREARAQNRRVEIVLNFENPIHLRRIYRRRHHGIFTYKKFDFRIF